jgi:hypothetical protein
MSDELTDEQRGALSELKSARGACPPAERLIDYEALDASARLRHAAHEHISICSRCQLVLLHVAGASPESLASPASPALRWMLPLAAITVLAVGVTLFMPNVTSNRPPETVRGTELQPMSPVGATELIREFSWQSPIVADRYRVTVLHGTTVVWQTETTTMRVAPPPAGTIVRDVQYEWRVEALDREGNVRMTSPSQSFVVY